jgi:hypothetical protein
MPFIGGRYYANALAGHAIEAAREAEAALLALKQKNKIKTNADAAAGSDADADGGTKTNRQPRLARAKLQFIAWRLRRQSWCRRTADARSADLWRGYIAIRQRPEMRRAAGERLRRGSCRREAMQRSRKHTFSPGTAICWIS